MEIHSELLDRLRSALRRQQAILVGLSSEIVEAGQWVSRCALAEQDAERQLPTRDSRRRQQTAQDGAAADLAAARAAQLGALYDHEAEAGRIVTAEQQTAQGLATAAQQQGIDPRNAVEHFYMSGIRVDAAALEQAWQQAVAARRRAEHRLAELEEERGRQGKRTGLLRQTIQEAETWLRANGMAIEAAA
jgi:hypothetical protein